MDGRSIWELLPFAPKHAVVALLLTGVLAIGGLFWLTQVNAHTSSSSDDDADDRAHWLRVALLVVATVTTVFVAWTSKGC
jgi:hypothetical protein